MLCLGLAAALIQTPPWPLTRAEKSNYTETSHYEDVVGFIQALEARGAPIRLEWIGTSTEGRKIPLVIASRPMMTPEQARRSGRPIIYIQANIHAGEVEGKEAALALLRDWSKGPMDGRFGVGAGYLPPGVFDQAVVLMTPIYNIDGNEKWGPVERNRPEQDGPAMVGVRPNGQNFDLNRDCIKAESPEMRAVLAHVWKGWDPDVLMDLHTTDGTRHGFELTYSPGLNPNTNPDVMHYTRDQLLPDVRRQIRKQYGIELFDYGNGEGGAWRSFEPLARYVTNYAGVRNRVSILSEATTFIPFRARVLATYEFVQTCVDRILRDAKHVVEMTRAADGWRPKELGVRFEMASRGMESVPLEKLAPGEKRPLSGRPKVLSSVKMPIFDRFKSTKMAAVPAAYLIPATETATIDLLRRHGVVVERTLADWTGPGERFEASKTDQTPRAFQGHKLIQLDGTFKPGQVTFPAGSYLVRTDQPLLSLIFTILEPESTDGAVAWGVLSLPYSPTKCPTPPMVPTEVVSS